MGVKPATLMCRYAAAVVSHTGYTRHGNSSEKKRDRRG